MLTLGQLFPGVLQRGAGVHQLHAHLPDLHRTAVKLLLLNPETVAFLLKIAKIEEKAIAADTEQRDAQNAQKRHRGDQSSQAAAEGGRGFLLRFVYRRGNGAGLLHTLLRD